MWMQAHTRLNSVNRFYVINAFEMYVINVPFPFHLARFSFFAHIFLFCYLTFVFCDLFSVLFPIHNVERPSVFGVCELIFFRLQFKTQYLRIFARILLFIQLPDSVRLSEHAICAIFSRIACCRIAAHCCCYYYLYSVCLSSAQVCHSEYDLYQNFCDLEFISVVWTFKWVKLVYCLESCFLTLILRLATFFCRQ